MITMYGYLILKRILHDSRYGEHKVDNNTHAHTINENQIGIKLHDTDVIVLNADGTYQLYSGGWFTNTTTNRINMFSPAKTIIKDGVMYILKDPYGKSIKSNLVVFEEGITIDMNGIPIIEEQE
jgi:hypothetical protein